MQLPEMNIRNKYFPMQHQSVINDNKKRQKCFLSYPILCPLYYTHQRNQIKTNLTQLGIYLDISCQVNIAKKAPTKLGHFIAQVHNIEAKWSIKPCIFRTKNVSKALRQKLVEWIMKILNVRESTISRDTLLITEA